MLLLCQLEWIGETIVDSNMTGNSQASMLLRKGDGADGWVDEPDMSLNIAKLFYISTSKSERRYHFTDSLILIIEGQSID